MTLDLNNFVFELTVKLDKELTKNNPKYLNILHEQAEKTMLYNVVLPKTKDGREYFVQFTWTELDNSGSFFEKNFRVDLLQCIICLIDYATAKIGDYCVIFNTIVESNKRVENILIIEDKEFVIAKKFQQYTVFRRIS